MMSAAMTANTPLTGILSALKSVFQKHSHAQTDRHSGLSAAFGLWASHDSNQTGNLLTDMEDAVFTDLLKGMKLKGKQVAYVGCGNGRQWPRLQKAKPASITGFDLSAVKLRRLEQKFPKAQTYQLTDSFFSDVADNRYDLIILDLSIPQFSDVKCMLGDMCRILKPGGDILITDFYPGPAIAGSLSNIADILIDNGFNPILQSERRIDETVKHYYEAKNAMSVYDEFKGAVIAHGIHLNEAVFANANSYKATFIDEPR